MILLLSPLTHLASTTITDKHKLEGRNLLPLSHGEVAYEVLS